MDKTLLRRRRFLTYAGLGALGIGSAAIATQLNDPFKSASKTNATAKSMPELANATPLPQPQPVSNQDTSQKQADTTTLPEFQGLSQWLNSEPLSIQSLLGNVVIVQFWTFGCINCQRTLPYITQWHEKYAAQGLKIIGIHTPEFAYERDINNVRDAMQKNGIYYPVALDNEFKTWRAYGNEYWPQLYLADRQGVLQYERIGEGAYDLTEQTIQKLLKS